MPTPETLPLRPRIRARAFRRSRSIRVAIPDRWNRFRRLAGECARSLRGRGAAAGGALRRGRIRDERKACWSTLKEYVFQRAGRTGLLRGVLPRAFPITEVLYNCPKCGGLIEAVLQRHTAQRRRVARPVPSAPLEQRASRYQRRLALSRAVSFPRRQRACGDAARREHAAAGRSHCGAVRRARQASPSSIKDSIRRDRSRTTA